MGSLSYYLNIFEKVSQLPAAYPADRAADCIRMRPGTCHHLRPALGRTIGTVQYTVATLTDAARLILFTTYRKSVVSRMPHDAPAMNASEKAGMAFFASVFAQCTFGWCWFSTSAGVVYWACNADRLHNRNINV